MFFSFRLSADLNNVNISSDSVQDWSVYLNGFNNIVLPLTLSPTSFPLLTIGAWVKPTGVDTRLDDPR